MAADQHLSEKGDTATHGGGQAACQNAARALIASHDAAAAAGADSTSLVPSTLRSSTDGSPITFTLHNPGNHCYLNSFLFALVAAARAASSAELPAVIRDFSGHAG